MKNGITTWKELQVGDIAQAPWDEDIFQVVVADNTPVGTPACVEPTIRYLTGNDARKGRKFGRTANAEHFVRVLRPGYRDVELARINLQRG